MRLLSQALPVKRRSSSKATAIGTYPMESPTPRPNTTSAASPSERRRCCTAVSTPGCSTRGSRDRPTTCGIGRWRRSRSTCGPPPTAATGRWKPSAVASPANGASPSPATTPRNHQSPQAVHHPWPPHRLPHELAEMPIGRSAAVTVRSALQYPSGRHPPPGRRRRSTLWSRIAIAACASPTTTSDVVSGDTEAGRRRGGDSFVASSNVGDQALDLFDGRVLRVDVLGHHRPVAHHRDPVDDLEDVVDVVGDEDAGMT
jgi:hypothetical protein